MNKPLPPLKSPKDIRKAFLSVFDETARYHHRREVFRDFVTLSALSLAAPMSFGELAARRAREYEEIAARYKPEDMARHTRLFQLTVDVLEQGPEDFLGPLYMDLGLGDARQGQFYTPHHVSKLIVELHAPAMLKALETKPYVTVSEPACGAGGMLLPLVDVLHRNGHDPATRLFVQAVDTDRLAALMCFIQISLWGVPAEVIVGNSLSLEVREAWHTAMYHLHGWRARLAAAGHGEGFTVPKPASKR